MSIIEGVGDEVTVLVTILVILFVLTLAWVSTSVVERPLLSVIILDRRTFQQFLARLRGRGHTVVTETQDNTPGSGNGTSPEAGEENNPQDPAPTDVNPVTQGEDTDNDPPNLEEEEASECPQTTASSNPSTDTVSEALDQPQLRQRRLNFFTNKEEGPSSVNAEGDEPTVGTEPASSPEGLDQTSSSPSGPEVNSPDEPMPEFSPEDGRIRIKIKFLDDRQRWVQAKPGDTIGQFKRANFSSELSENSAVRMIYNGRELSSESASLASYNVGDESVLHCLVSQVAPQRSENLNRNAPIDIGSLMFPLFGLILALLWYSRFTYKQFFNTMSTLTLVGISLLFLVSFIASFRHHEPYENEAN